MANYIENDFCLEIQYQKDSENPERIFRALTDLIESFKEVDKDLVKSLDLKVQPVLLLENIETGSIKTWFRTQLELIDDEALKKMDWKSLVGQYLVKAKYRVIQFLGDRNKITERSEIKAIEQDLYKLAEETDIKIFPNYAPIPLPKIIEHLSNISSALSHLKISDRAILTTSEGSVRFNNEFEIQPETIEKLLTKEIIKNTNTMILKVKKPDYLGDSKWEFKHENKSLPVKILADNWLKAFQHRKFDIRPGDSIKAKIEIEYRYGYDNELINTHYYLIEVLDIIQYDHPDQLGLFPTTS